MIPAPINPLSALLRHPSQSRLPARAGTDTFTSRDDFELVGRVVAEKLRRERNQWRNA